MRPAVSLSSSKPAVLHTLQEPLIHLKLEIHPETCVRIESAVANSWAPNRPLSTPAVCASACSGTALRLTASRTAKLLHRPGSWAPRRRRCTQGSAGRQLAARGGGAAAGPGRRERCRHRRPDPGHPAHVAAGQRGRAALPLAHGLLRHRAVLRARLAVGSGWGPHPPGRRGALRCRWLDRGAVREPVILGVGFSSQCFGVWRCAISISSGGAIGGCACHCTCSMGIIDPSAAVLAPPTMTLG